MRILLARVVFGGILIAPLPQTRAQTPPITPAAEREKDATLSVSGMDVWTDLEDAIRMICIVVGCHLDRSKQTSMLSGNLEADGWRVTMQYEVSGVRPDLSPQETTSGSAAALRIVSILSTNTTIVSEELRAVLTRTASSIHNDLRN